MMSLDKDAVICDLAETYQIFNYKALPVHTLAVLVFGLRADSRIKMRAAGFNAEISMRALLARCADVLNALIKSPDDDSETFIEIMKGADGEAKKSVGFDSIEEYEAARRKFLKG